MSDQSKPKWNTPEYRKMYYAKNKEKLKAQMLAYREAHREELRLYAQQYYAENRDLVLSKSKDYSASHKEERRSYQKATRGKQNSQQRERRKNNPEFYRQKEKRVRENNPEGHAAKNKRAYLKQRDKWLEKSRQWQKANRPKINESSRKWRQANPDKVLASSQRKYRKHKAEIDYRNWQWRQKNPDRVKAMSEKTRRTKSYQAWLSENRERYNRMRNEKYHQYREQYREFYRLYGSKAPRRCVIFMKWEMAGHLCYICGQDLPFEDIHADHVIPITKGGSNDISNLMPTHSKCNKNKSDKLDYPVKRPDLVNMVIHIEAHPRNVKRKKVA